MTTEHVMENEPIQVRMFAQITNRNFDNSSASKMKQWICNVNVMKKRVEKLLQGDKRWFFS